VLASGITSAATIANASVGYLNSFVVLPPIAASLGLIVLMTAINFMGIQESARVNFVLTMIELGGLLLVIGVGVHYASTHVTAADISARLQPPGEMAPLLGAATIAFFAYIGFEDTANVAEEVQDAQRVMPRAILTAISATCVLYVTIAIVALLTVPMDTLASSDAPLLEVLNTAGVHLPANTFSLIALFAICNTGLLNLIMVSRLGYGMAREGLLPAVLAEVHPIRRTPWVAVLVASGLAALLAVSGGIKVLAQTTSLMLLGVFAVLHVGLLRIKRRDPNPGDEVFRTPMWTPLVGAVICGGMTLQYPAGAYLRAFLVLLAAASLYAALHWGRNNDGSGRPGTAA
jgi:amino acid transporter